MRVRAITIVSALPLAAPLAAQSPAGAIARCESLLVPQQEAAKNPKRPYALDLHTRGNSELTYIGVRHTADPADSQFVRLRREFSDLKPTIAFYEGAGAPVRSTLDEAIRTDEEPGAIRYFANAAGVPAKSFEPVRADEVAELLHSFSAEDLVMFYVLRPIMEVRTRSHMVRPALDSVLARQLVAVHRTPGLGNVLPDTAALRAAFASKYPGIDMLAVPPDWFNPQLLSEPVPKRLFNAINYASSMFRDVYMYRQLAAALLLPNERIFAEVGRDHIPAQAAALQCVAGAN